MKLIEQSFEILEQKDFTLKGIKQFIERCGRVCYKSENRITDDSYEKFVNMLVKRDHARPLEFGTVHLKIKYSEFQAFMQALYTEGIYNDIWIKVNGDGEFFYITTNYRYYLYIIKHFPWISTYFDELNSNFYPKRYTVHFITNRVTMDSFRTHVALSHLGESTRYCNYSKDKFNNEITFVLPPHVNTHCPNKKQEGPSFLDIMWSDACKKAEDYYFSLIKGGWAPQQARDVLPLSVKSELISCGFVEAWENFFYRRCDNAAHPMARELANKVKDEFIKRNYIKA